MILWAGLNCCTSYLLASLSSSCLRKQGKEDAVQVTEMGVSEDDNKGMDPETLETIELIAGPDYHDLETYYGFEATLEREVKGKN